MNTTACLPTPDELVVGPLTRTNNWCQLKDIEKIWQVLSRLYPLPSDQTLEDLFQVFEMERDMYWFMHQHDIRWKAFSTVIDDIPVNKRARYKRECDLFYNRVLRKYKREQTRRAKLYRDTLHWFEYGRSERTWWDPHLWEILLVLRQIQEDEQVQQFLQTKDGKQIEWKDAVDSKRGFQNFARELEKHKAFVGVRNWIRNRPWPVQRYLPNLACQLTTHFLQRWDERLSSWSVVRILGAGVFGITLLLADNEKEVRAFKLMVNNPAAQWIPVAEEVRMQEIAAKHGLASAVFQQFKKENAVAILTERMHVTLNDYVECWYEHKKTAPDEAARMAQQLIEGLNELWLGMGQLEMTHGDAHSENIMLRLTDDGKCEIKFIDFGMASDRLYFPQLDMLKLMGDLRTSSKGTKAFAKLWEPQAKTLMQQLLSTHKQARLLDPYFTKLPMTSERYNKLFTQRYRKHLDAVNPQDRSAFE